MTHRSRLSTILIDAPSGEAPAAAAFWSQALGVPARTVPDEEQFTSLRGALPDLVLAVQAVDDQARYHVDIETDDVEAETRRLVALGAVETGCWLECRTLQAPGGHLVCVILGTATPRRSNALRGCGSSGLVNRRSVSALISATPEINARSRAELRTSAPASTWLPSSAPAVMPTLKAVDIPADATSNSAAAAGVTTAQKTAWLSAVTTRPASRR